MNLIDRMNLQLFDVGPVNFNVADIPPTQINRTTDVLTRNASTGAITSATNNDLSVEMKTFYDMRLIDMAEPKLVHDQFAQKRPIPKNGGKTIEFRKYAPLAKNLTPLTEGVTPEGKKLTASAITATVSQYGDFIRLSDVLQLTALDNNVLEATKVLGQQAGKTLDTITRNVLQSGTNVTYASTWSGTTETEVYDRADLDSTAILKVETVNRVVAKLRAMDAPTINGDYVGIIHPYVAYDLMRDPEWIDSHKYATPENLYAGEIGRIGGVRFVQSSEAYIAGPEPLYEDAGGMKFTHLHVKTAVAAPGSTSVTVQEAVPSTTFTSGKTVYINGTSATLSSITYGANGSTLTFSSAVTAAKNAVIAGAGGTSGGLAVFCSLFLGEGAYGVTEITGGGLQTVIKQLGSGEDPLNQRSSVGWKAMKTAEILIPDYLVRVESVSTRFSRHAAGN